MPLPLVLLGHTLAAPYLPITPIFPAERAAADPVAEAEIRVVISEETPDLLGGLLLEESEMVVETYAGIARVTLHQWFSNPYAAAQGAYLLPLPDEALVDAAEITCDGSYSQAEVVERSGLSEGKGLSRFVLDDGGIFAWELPRVCAGEVAVTVQYLLPLHSDGGRYSLDIPPPPESIDGLPWEFAPPPTRRLTVYLDERMPIADLSANSEPLDLSACAHRYGRVASLAPEPGQPIHLSWALSGASAVAYQPDPTRPGYLALSISPEVLGRLPRQSARELLFVVDSSCSVRGAPYEMARATVLATLDTLTPADTFNLYPLDEGMPPLFDAPRAADADTRAAADAWLAAGSGGSSGSASGLRSALALPATDAHRQLLLLTDGHLDGSALRALLSEESGTARIHPVGLGPYANRSLLLQLAAEGRGAALWPEPGESADDTVERLITQLQPPALRDVQIDWGGLEIIEQLPARLPDMSASSPLRVLARYSPDESGPTTIRIQGHLSETPIALELTVPRPEASNEALSPLWASEKIGALALQGESDPRAVREEIVAVALSHGITTRYTALAGPDSTPVTAPAAAAPISAALAALEWSEAPPIALTRPPPQPPRRAPPRRVRMSTVGMNLPSGESTWDIIQLVDARQGQIETCYQDRLQYRPQLAGSVAVEVDVVGGKVSGLALAENTTGDDWLAQCALRRIRRWEYPEDVTGRIYLPFALSTAD
jgi:Ca-activated chloride channel family protein